MNKSYLIAAAAAIVLGAWMASGMLGRDEGARAGVTAQEPAAGQAPMRVQVREQTARPVTRELVVQGQSEARRTVTLKAETAGSVAAIGAERGSRVQAGALLVELAMDEREARRRQAQALVRQRESEYAAARDLQRSGHQSKTRLDEALADLEAARAELARVEVDIDHTRITAPFPGVLHERTVEVGGYVDPGAPVATLVDDATLKVTGQVAQQSIGQLRQGQSARVRLITGQEATGAITYIAASADAATRTFRVEVEIPNPDGALAAGVSAEIHIPLETVAAHHLSPAALSLGDDGTLGVKTVDDAGRVAFHPVQIVRTAADGIWVTGLPEHARIITVGQGFVRAGEAVVAVRADPELSAAGLAVLRNGRAPVYAIN